MSFKKLTLVVGLLAVVMIGFWPFDTEQPAMQEPDESEIASMAFRQQILHASDLVAGVAEAVKNSDEQALAEWQQRAIEVANAAELKESDIEFIRSENGREYLVFHAKRYLFNQEFEAHYYQLKGIDALKTRYPQARDLFAEAEKLIDARDAIIRDIASEIKSDTITDEEAMSQAKTLWQERFRQSEKLADSE